MRKVDLEFRLFKAILFMIQDYMCYDKSESEATAMILEELDVPIKYYNYLRNIYA